MINQKSLKLFFAISALLVLPSCRFQAMSIGNSAALDSESEIYGADSDCIREIPDLYISPIRTDADLDLMDDSWELWNQLDPENPDDAEFDVDGDGFSNLEEYQVDTDPNLARYNPGVIEVTTVGFDCFYTAEIGYINSDNLLDILIHDPSTGYLPPVLDFVMIQQQDHSFALEDAKNYEIPELISIQPALVLANLNGDTSQDIALVGLSSYIPEVEDQIIFGEIGEIIVRGIHLDVVPYNHKELDSETTSFFYELHQWRISQDFFDSNARIIAMVPEILELGWVLDENEPAVDDCDVGLTRCFVVLADENDPVNSNIESALSIEYLSLPYKVELSDHINNPNELDYFFQVKAVFSEVSEVNILDYSHFDQEALHLAKNDLLQVLHGGVLFYPSAKASRIYRILEEQLGSSVFFNSYLTPYWGVYDKNIEFKYIGNDSILGAIQGILSLIADRFVRVPDTYLQEIE